MLHLSITDAVGHEVEAALLATLLVGGLRNGRRRGLTLLGQAGTANDALAAHTRAGEFVTGQLLRVDLRSGNATIINAGHPLPLRLRNGSRRGGPPRHRPPVRPAPEQIVPESAVLAGAG
jgi:serine phosphatase RsbU (regulator of sigma subunit)